MAQAEYNKGELERYQFAFVHAGNKSTAFEFFGRQLAFFSRGLIRQRRAENENL
jgi:hypothetical protein